MAGRNRQASAFADGVVGAQRGSDGLAGYIVAWPAAEVFAYFAHFENLRTSGDPAVIGVQC